MLRHAAARMDDAHSWCFVAVGQGLAMAASMAVSRCGNWSTGRRDAARGVAVNDHAQDSHRREKVSSWVPFFLIHI